jgi:uncharacterized protein YuzE
MRLEYDKDADAVYVYMRDLPYAYSKVVDDERSIDFATDQQPIGVESLHVSAGVNVDDLPERAAIVALLQEHDVKVFA